jgi:predicted nucleic acid-binding protein
VNELVLDASVLVKWFKVEHEAHVEAARSLETRYLEGGLLISVPPLLFIEILNVAARRWGWGAASLAELAVNMLGFGFDVHQPELARVAHWTSRGLTAYDACYVALAEERKVPLVTADDRILTLAGDLARALDRVSS